MAKAKKVEKRSAPKKTAKPARMTKRAKPEIKSARYPERVPDDPLGIAKSLRAIQKSKPSEPEQPKMEVSVRNIYYDGQYLPALCFRKPGAMHVPCVAGDPVNGVRKFTVAASQHDKSTVLQHGYGNFAAEYTPERFASHMRRIVGAAPITPEARALLLPYCSDMPAGPVPSELPAVSPADVIERAGAGGTADAYRSPRPLNGARKASAGPSRTDGKELIRALAAAAKLPPEKVRAKLRAAGMRAPYTDETACRKALGVK
jgi:hypothetical protein